MAISYKKANIESDLHDIITQEAHRNQMSFSAQIRGYRDQMIALDEKVDELRIEIKKVTDVN
jgi:hypothetical protein